MSNPEKRPQALPDWFTADRIDTVIVAFTGVYGRVLGKRMTYDHFVNHVLDSGTHACSYLLTTDIGMNSLPGFDLASWEQGYGDFHVRPDMSTLRNLPWYEGTAAVMCDLFHDSGAAVEESPRQVLRRQVEKLAEAGMKAYIGSELEFHLFSEDYRTITEKGFRDLSPTSSYFIDYHVLQPGRDEDVLRRIRNELTAAGIPVECSKGECGNGQHEVNLVYTEPIEMADRHVLYKAGVKEIGSQQGKAITFMAKWGADEAGNGFHLHTSLWTEDGKANLFSRSQSGDTPRGGSSDGASGRSKVFTQFLGGLLKYSRELSYFFAPTVNSYKRYQPNSWAPTAVVCGHDNRTCGYRVVGHGDSLRIENRMPGADANAYLTFAATLAAGMRGIEEDLDSGPIYEGNAYADDTLPRLPGSLEEAGRLLAESELARSAFGSNVVDLYAQAARLEVQASRRAVTDWELRRYFEQM